MAIDKTIICRQCGESFERSASKRGPKPKYCKRRCAEIAQYKRERLPDTIRESTCNHCNQVYKYKGHKHRYCTPECKKLAQAARNKKIEKICLFCQVKYMAEAGNQGYCSRACRNMVQRNWAVCQHCKEYYSPKNTRFCSQQCYLDSKRQEAQKGFGQTKMVTECKIEDEGLLPRNEPIESDIAGVCAI